MDIDNNVVTYVAQKALSDFKSNSLSDELASSLSLRPWVDAIREHIDPTFWDEIKAVLQEPNQNPSMTHFAINAARGIETQEIIPLVRECFEKSSDMPNTISAMLVLASYGEMEGKWDKELARIATDKQALIKCVMDFYGCSTKETLRKTLQQRQNDVKYECNIPYYTFLLKIIDE
jgi:hypothetical protein